MGLDDKIRNQAQEMMGKAKQKMGDATDDPRLQAQGLEEQAEAKAKQTAEEVREKFE